MSLYEQHILPYLIHAACGIGPIRSQREKIVPRARGRVLEVGMGSGLNLPLYDAGQVEFIWGLEPSPGMRRKAAANVAHAGVEVKWLDLPGEEIPLDTDSVDTVVLTYTLCSIAGWEQALDQMRRVLTPGGSLLFCEHGLAPDPAVEKWQHRLNPVWKRIAGGCHLDRPIPRLLESRGFAVRELASGYLPGPRFATFNYWGMAVAG